MLMKLGHIYLFLFICTPLAWELWNSGWVTFRVKKVSENNLLYFLFLNKKNWLAYSNSLKCASLKILNIWLWVLRTLSANFIFFGHNVSWAVSWSVDLPLWFTNCQQLWNGQLQNLVPIFKFLKDLIEISLVIFWFFTYCFYQVKNLICPILLSHILQLVLISKC